MARRQALVPEIPVDLVHFLETTDGESLQIQLRRNAQIHWHIQGIVVSDEGLGGGTTGDGVKHGGFDFHETPVIKEPADKTDRRGTHFEQLATLWIDDEIDITLPIAQFLVRKAVIFIRQGAQGLGQQPGAFHIDVEIALAAAVQGAGGSHDVTQIPASNSPQGIGVKRLAINVELQAGRTILYQQKRASVAHQSTRDREHPVALFQIFLAGLGKF